MMRELGVPVSAASVARHYGDLLDGFVADENDPVPLHDLNMPVLRTATWMTSMEHRDALARAVLGFARELDTNKQRRQR